MARSSLVHYIIPSAISITPNCNSSVSDLAVYVARGAKIKVNSKKAGIDTAGGSYQEWVLTGRNRRLADSTVPYTIYARLRKTDKTDGYLMFVPQQQVSGEWKDKYPYVTIDGLYRDVYGSESSDYYYVRLGDVTLPGADGREVILDTGILGTEQYNEEWNLNPDNLPVRVDIGCTIDDEDAGPTPYVYFGKTLVLTASLQEGWSDTDVERFDHWEIARNTGDATADAAWPSQERQAQFAESGTIDLVHTRDDDDDFNGAVSGIFTVTAWGLEDDSSGTPAPVVIATASISIMAETVEKYDLQLSANIVSYSPQTGAYTPADGVKVAIRATDQRGDVFNMTNQQVQSGRLSADYAPVDSSDWTPLVFSGGAAEEAQATIPISAFSSEQGLKVRLLRTVDASTGKVMEMTGATIAFVRDGEDSKEREWIFQHTLTVTTYGDEHSEHPRPSVIDGGEVKPSGVAGGDDHNKDQDGWVPQGWCDNPQGIDETYQFEYGSYRDFIHSDSSGSSSGRGGHWGEFTEPRIWNHYAGDAVTYDIVPSVSVINADAAGTVTSDGIIVRAYQTKGSERSENILPNSDYPESGDYYFAEYSVDGGEWTRCEAFDYPAAGGTVIPVYGIPADAVRTATEGITLRLKHSSDITFVLKENTPIKVLRVISEDEVSDMVQELGREEFLSRLYDDFASGEIGFLKGLWVKAKNLYGISEDGDARLHDTDISGTAHVGEDLNIDGELHGISAVLNKIVSSEYTGDGMLDTGFLLQYAEGRAKLVVDDLVARGKFTVNELETRIWTYAGGNMIFSGAGSTVFFVEYLDASDNILGYTSINAPWLLNGRPLLSAMVAWSKRRSVQRSLTDEEKASVVKFRCYEYSDDGTMQTRNWWHVNDLALCQTLNKVKDKADSDGSYSGYASNTVYHRRVAGIGSKKIAAMGDDRVYDYVDLWNIYDVQGQTYIDAQGQERTITDDVKGFLNMAPTGQAPSTDWPAAGDVIVQVGNPLDTDRQGAVTIEVQGDTHGLKVYDTISGYSMENKLWVEIGYDQNTGKAKANVYGDFRFGCRASEEQGGGSYVKYNRTTGQLDIRANVRFTSPTTHTETSLDNFASAVVGDLNSLQSQIDGQIESWFYNYSPVATDSQGVPTSKVPLNVAPYSEWTTDALKIAHLNDTFTNNKTGYCWRFSRNASTNAFEWVIIEDSAVIKALQDAAKAQDTADHKRRVFICDADNQTPVPPYDAGDLWVNVKYPWATGATYNNEILKCDKPVPREEDGQQITGFNINDWSLSNGYTSKLNTFINNTYAPFVEDISQQVDKKAETFRQASDPSSSWYDASQTPVYDVRAEHVGDIWMDISANGGKKTYIYTDKGTEADPRYVWEEQAVPDEVFDEIDGKAEIFVSKPTAYLERDLWIIESGLADADMPAGCQAGDIVVADNMPQGTTKRTTYVKSDWRKKDRYTDDTKANEVALGLAKEITDRGKAVSDAQTAAAQDATNKVNAASQQLTEAINAVDNAHSTAEGALEDGYIDNDEREALKAVQKSLDAEFTDVTASYSVVYNNSLLNGTTQKTALYNAYTALVSAHDAYDAAFTSFIDAPATTKYEKGDSEGDYTYTPEGAQEAITVNLTTLQTTFNTCASTYQTALESANAKIQDEIKKIADAAVSEITSYRYIANAIDASTVIQGGLMLTSAIFLRQLKEDGDPEKESDYITWAGINGTTPDGDSSIAAWYGGDMEDKQAAGTPDPTVRYAKSLFRMDGSGYLADGNISWDNSGNATFKGTISAGTTITDYQYLKTALGGDTSGLVLANQIALKNGNNIMAGMSGVYNAQSPGGGIAGWYGGTKNDRENAPEGTDVSAYAKTLFRMDGTGYVASGNISWNASGDVTIQGTVVEATSKIDTPAIYLNGTDITATLNAILDMFEKDTTTQPGTTLIKAKYSLYSVGDVSALGNSSGGGGGGGGAGALYELNDVSPNASGTGVLYAQEGYALVYNGTSNHWEARSVMSSLTAASASALGGIKIGYNGTTAKTYAVQLDSDNKAYVAVPWEDHTYTLADLVGSTAIGSATNPIYWTGSAFAATTYTLAKSVPADAVFTDHYAWSDITSKPSTFTPSAHDHSRIVTEGDNRSVATTPNDYVNELVFTGLKSNNVIGSPYTDSYSYVLGLRGWSDSSGGNAHELAFNGNGIYRRQGATTSWGNWYHLLDSGNSSVSKSGSTLTVKINGTEQSLTNTWRPLGTGASDACAGNDSRLSDSRPASDVYSWAKAATKPSYTLDEVNDGSTRKLSSYLPLSGGTMTGVLTLKGSQYAGYMTGSSRTYAMNANNSDIVGINALIMADKSDGWTESIGFPRDGSDAGHYDTFRAANGTFYFGFNGYYDSSNVEHAASELITMTGSTVKLERSDANNAEMTVKNSNGSVSLFTSTNRGLYNNNGSNWIIATNGTNTWMSVGNVGIGTSSPSYKLHVSGSGYFTGHTYFNDWIDVTQGVAARCLELDPPNGTSDGGYIDFHYGGSSADYTSRLIESSIGVVSLYGSFYATGDVTAASDQRKKEFVEDVVLTLEQIANAPAVKFRWKDDRDSLVHIGTYAQYWQDILPESVSDRGGDLGFTYGNTALVAVKNLARYVMQLEEEVRQLKKKQKNQHKV